MLLTTYVLIMIVQATSGSVATQRISTFPGQDACAEAARDAKIAVPLASAQIGFICVPWKAVGLPKR